MHCWFSPSLLWGNSKPSKLTWGVNWVHPLFSKLEQMWEECVNVWGECICSAVYPEDLGKSISISGGQKTQSDPCYTLTKVLIRISLKGRKRQQEKHIAWSKGCFGQEPVGRAHCSVRLNSRDREDVHVWMSLFLINSFSKPFRTKVSHGVLAWI